MKKFGYDSDMKYIDAYNYFSDGPTYDKWDEILYKEIGTAYPEYSVHIAPDVDVG